MNTHLLPQLSWTFLGITIMLLVITYSFFVFEKSKIQTSFFRKRTKNFLHDFFRQTLVLYELFFALIIGSIFFLINPIWHGILILIVLLISFPFVRNYVLGKLLCLDKNFQVGKTITTNSIKGIISKINGLGVYIMTSEGTGYINYFQLYKNGFNLHIDNQTKEYCYLNISPLNKAAENSAQVLLFKLMAVPYLDSSYKPVLSNDINDNKIQFHVLIRQGNHKQELASLIQEWGFSCQFTH